jgi:chromosome segregation ATPase
MQIEWDKLAPILISIAVSVGTLLVTFFQAKGMLLKARAEAEATELKAKANNVEKSLDIDNIEEKSDIEMRNYVMGVAKNLTSRVAVLEEKLEQAETDRDSAQQQVNDLKIDLNDAQVRLLKVTERLEDLERVRSEEHRQFQILQQQLTEERNKSAKLQTRVTDLEAEVNELRTLLKSATELNLILQKQIRTLSAQVRSTQEIKADGAEKYSSETGTQP